MALVILRSFHSQIIVAGAFLHSQTASYFKPIDTLVFEEIPKLEGLADLKNLKKLQGYENAYRIKVGDYRIGVTC
ncbi:hypothetical protein V2H45_08470 [Tumidithrix elongata RA019]|uniref:Uncharacterized protein n=1 Tax=Tumidithrix elongata BACA0141 TaxID=2716417 RepID=A0AAW9PWM6_9CYAN|nr:hypothetical protein [Tumidithrix elongata RA019]